MQERHQKWPFSMNATMTHDAKRAEDVRTRIDVLSEIPEEWEGRLNTWSEWNESKCRRVKGVRAPERNEETLLYQTLIGSWPVGQNTCSCYAKRIQEFMVKAVREAMVHTRWTIPNLEHEQALTDFVRAILQDSSENRFLQDFKSFTEKVAYHGSLNSLSQLVVKLASPGVADFYQGAETWDLRLVDPDNRQPVDFLKRKDMLASLENKTLPDLVEHWQDGRIKMYVMRRGLQFRKRHAALFLKGDYVPIQVQGPLEDCTIAFARRYRGDWSVVVVPRFTTRLIKTSLAAEDTYIVLPKQARRRWINVFDDQRIVLANDVNNQLRLADLHRQFPVALLSNEQDKMHSDN